MVAATLEPERLLFVDECGTHTSNWHRSTDTRTQRRAITAFGTTQAGQEHYTVLSSMSLEGMGPSLRVEGATTALVFEAYVEQVLVLRAFVQDR
jgi:hypothetical protein